jgi:hypothetical protein
MSAPPIPSLMNWVQNRAPGAASRMSLAAAIAKPPP